MKKFLSLLMAGTMSLSILTGVALADNKNQVSKQKSSEVKSEKKLGSSVAKVDNKALLTKIKANRKTILSLQSLFRASDRLAKSNIKTLNKSGNMTPAMAETIKGYLKQIRELRAGFAKSEAKFRANMKKFKSEKGNKITKNSLALELAKQEAKIEMLKKITEINKLIVALKAPVVAIPAPTTSTTPEPTTSTTPTPTTSTTPEPATSTTPEPTTSTTPEPTTSTTPEPATSTTPDPTTSTTPEPATSTIPAL